MLAQILALKMEYKKTQGKEPNCIIVGRRELVIIKSVLTEYDIYISDDITMLVGMQLAHINEDSYIKLVYLHVLEGR